jgi:hypothetical protein
MSKWLYIMEWSSVFILAQVGPSFEDFFQQIPTGLILMFCGTGIILLVVMVLIVRARAQRAERTRIEHPHIPVSSAARPAAGSSAELTDLPDLDLLVETPAPPPAAPPAAVESAPVRAARKDTFQVNLSDGDRAQAVEVVTILRDVVDGGLIIQMGDRVYRDLSADEGFRDTFLKVMRELSPVVAQATGKKPPTGELRAADTPPATSPKAAPSLRDLLIEGELKTDDEPATAAPRSAAPPPPAADGTMPGDLPRYSLDEQPQVVKKRSGLLGRQKTEYVPVPELNLADAIENYLQHKLRHTDDFAGRSIHVHPAPDGGVAIEVDGAFYDSVGDVTDGDVRAFLAQTIQEWQARNTGS